MIENDPAHEPQKQNLPPQESTEPSVWSPEYGTEGQSAVGVAGSAAVRGNVEWDQPERRDVRETGGFSEKEIEQVGKVYTLLRQTMMPPEAAKAAGPLTPTAAKQHLDFRLQAIERGVGEGTVSKRMAMIVGTMVAASPLGNDSKVADQAVKLIGSGAFPEGQYKVLMTARGNMVRALAEHTVDEAAELKRIDGFLYGADNAEGFLPQVDQPAQQHNENLAAFWLAYAVGLDTSADATRRFRDLTNYMQTGRRGPDYMPLE